MKIYGSQIEHDDVELIGKLGFHAVNPNSQVHIDAIRNMSSGSEKMDYFCDVVQSCNVLFFRALPDGSIPAGVAKEIKCAQERSIPVFEIPYFNRKVLTVEETRAYIKDRNHEDVKLKLVDA
jgi:hypothetical protein